MQPANALRLSALVVAAMASGYLWRGAVELRKPAKALRTAVPAIGFELSDAPFSSLGLLRARVPAQSAARKGRAVAHATPRRSTPGLRSSAAQLIAVVEASPTSSPRAGRSKHPSRARAAQPRPKPPANGGRPKPPPPPPVQQPPPPPPVSQPDPPPPPPPPPPAGPETRPGRGKGDRNHSHTGPPGQKKQKKQKGEKGKNNDQGQESAKEDKGAKGQGKGKKGKK